jgi:hypothetical protein
LKLPLYLRAESPSRKPANPAHAPIRAVPGAVIPGRAEGASPESIMTAPSRAIVARMEQRVPGFRCAHPGHDCRESPPLGHGLTVPHDFLNRKFFGKLCRFVDNRPCQLCQRKILGAAQIRAPQDRAVQNSILEVGAPKTGIREIRLAKVCPLQIRKAQVCAAQICSAHIEREWLEFTGLLPWHLRHRSTN